MYVEPTQPDIYCAQIVHLPLSANPLKGVADTLRLTPLGHIFLHLAKALSASCLSLLVANCASLSLREHGDVQSAGNGKVENESND
jgi:hypothetical protein